MTVQYRPLKWSIAADGNYHNIPSGAILHLGHREGTPADRIYIWTLEPVSYTLKNPNLRRVKAYPTGAVINLDDRDKFLGTVLVQGGIFVWHVFEKAKEESDELLKTGAWPNTIPSNI